MQQEIQTATVNNCFKKFCCKRAQRKKDDQQSFFFFFKMGGRVFIYANGKEPIEGEIDVTEL